MLNTDGGSSLPERPVPANLEAERGVIAGAILDPDQIDDLGLIVSPGDFWRDAHEALWRSILRLRAKGVPVDCVAVADDLARDGSLGRLGGMDLIGAVVGSVPHAANARYHAGIVREKAIARRVIQDATDTLRDAYSGTMTAGELLEAAERRVFAVAEQHVTGDTVSGETLAGDFLAMQVRREAGQLEGLTTGLADLDDILCGMRAQQLIVLAARPGQGKTSLALNIAQHVTLDLGKPALMISLEMSREELTERWISSMASIDSRRLRDPRSLARDERSGVAASVSRLAESPFLIDDTPGQTLARIGANARRMKSRGGLALLVVDYLGYVNGEQQGGESNYAVVSRVSRGLKAMAKELHVPLLACHQLNRKCEDRGDQRPRMADLRDSGQIEADADVVMLLHAQAIEGRPTGAVELIVAKNRNGPPGVVNLAFSGPFTRFDSISIQPQQEVAF